MKLNCSQKDLSFALNIVNKAVSNNNTLPVLNNILMKAEGKKINLAATNLEIAITYVINADIKNEGKITIPSKLISNYVGLLDDGDIELKVEEGWNFNVKSSRAETKIKGINPEEFPLIPKVENATLLKVKRENLLKAIHQTVFAASSNISRPVLTGILFLAEKDTMKLVATDSFRLSEKAVTLDEKIENNIKCVVPSKTVSELGRILSAVEDKEIEIHVSQNQILFKAGNVELVSRLIEGAFPEYEKIIPKGKKTSIVIKVNDFVKAVKKVGLFVMETNNNVKISITNDGKMLLSTDETQIGEGKAEIDGNVDGENNKIALNAQYLLEFLNNSDLEEIMFEMDNKLSPAVLKPVKEQDFLHIIMPLKL